jgi:CubicO group peptidase (beta-lactamase class C family)
MGPRWTIASVRRSAARASFSTAADISCFYQMLLNKGEMGGRRILKTTTVTEMTRKQTGDLPHVLECRGDWDFASSRIPR